MSKCTHVIIHFYTLKISTDSCLFWSLFRFRAHLHVGRNRICFSFFLFRVTFLRGVCMYVCVCVCVEDNGFLVSFPSFFTLVHFLVSLLFSLSVFVCNCIESNHTNSFVSFTVFPINFVYVCWFNLTTLICSPLIHRLSLVVHFIVSLLYFSPRFCSHL